MACYLAQPRVTLKRVAIEDFDDFVFSSDAGGNNADTKEHLEAFSSRFDFDRYGIDTKMAFSWTWEAETYIQHDF
uniref:Uncharacterized protein n=1 Tax=Oryza punctata TaxID=4537 RepID=A0A0E0JN72_ORYPU